MQLIIYDKQCTKFRAKKVHDGVTHAAKLFPNGYIIMLAVGAVKGNGAGFVKVILTVPPLALEREILKFCILLYIYIYILSLPTFIQYVKEVMTHFI